MSGFDAPVPLLPEILALHGKWRADRDAVICGDTRWTWRQFTAHTHGFAHGLIDQGLRPGDRVVVLMSNGAPMVQALFGIMAAGGVSVPINLSVTDEAVAAMITDANAAAVVVTSDQQPRIDGLRAQLPETTSLFVCDGGDSAGWWTIEELTYGRPGYLPAVDLADDDLLNIIYSSGTTGMPKGITHTHRGRRDWAYDLCVALRYHGGARTLLTIGLYSNISWVAMLCTLLSGGTILVHKKFDAAAFLETVEAEGVTHTAMVPIQFQRVVQALETMPTNLSSMQAMMSCGSPLRGPLKEAIFQHFPCGIVELYGLTEGIITTLDPEDAPGRWSSVGRPLLGTDLRILGDDDHELGPGEAGEIVSRGRITMPGYWQRDDANEEASYIDDHGRQWLRSGDVGQLDAEGFLYIVDRKKDMILSGGQNVFPQDIEAILANHPAVDDVAVIGVTSDRWGETPVAIVVPVAAERERLGELLCWANERLGRQQRLADVKEVDVLPRNPNGKILKRELRQQFAELRYE